MSLVTGEVVAHVAGLDGTDPEHEWTRGVRLPPLLLALTQHIQGGDVGAVSRQCAPKPTSGSGFLHGIAHRQYEMGRLPGVHLFGRLREDLELVQVTVPFRA